MWVNERIRGFEEGKEKGICLEIGLDGNGVEMNSEDAIAIGLINSELSVVFLVCSNIKARLKKKKKKKHL